MCASWERWGRVSQLTHIMVRIFPQQAEWLQTFRKHSDNNMLPGFSASNLVWFFLSLSLVYMMCDSSFHSF